MFGGGKQMGLSRVFVSLIKPFLSSWKIRVAAAASLAACATDTMVSRHDFTIQQDDGKSVEMPGSSIVWDKCASSTSILSQRNIMRDLCAPLIVLSLLAMTSSMFWVECVAMAMGGRETLPEILSVPVMRALNHSAAVSFVWFLAISAWISRAELPQTFPKPSRDNVRKASLLGWTLSAITLLGAFWPNAKMK